MEEKTLKEVCTFYAGTGFPTKYQGKQMGELPFYKVGDISRNAQDGNKYLQMCENYVDRDEVGKMKGSILPKDTIVFAKIGEAVKLNRRAITSVACLVDNNVMGIAPNEVLILDYFYYFMRNLRMETLAESTTVPSVRKSRLEELKITVPKREIQEEICCKICTVENAIKHRRKQLEQLDIFIKARFVEMFGDVILNPKGWNKAQLGDVCDVRDGTHDSPQYYETGYPWCCTIKVDTLFSRILIYNHNQYENRRNSHGTKSKIL